MQTDPLYKKSLAAVFIIAIFGISLFLNFNLGSEQKSEVTKPEENPENKLANISSQEIPKLEGLENLETETDLLESEKNSDKSSEENLDDLLKNFE